MFNAIVTSILAIYGGQSYWQRTPAYQDKLIDMPSVTDTF